MSDLFGESIGIRAVQIDDVVEAECITCRTSPSKEDDVPVWVRIHVLDTGHVVRSWRTVKWEHRLEDAPG